MWLQSWQYLWDFWSTSHASFNFTVISHIKWYQSHNDTYSNCYRSNHILPCCMEWKVYQLASHVSMWLTVHLVTIQNDGIKIGTPSTTKGNFPCSHTRHFLYTVTHGIWHSCPFSCTCMHTSTPSQNSCAGLIAAVANEVCGVGVAYRAQVSGIRLLDRKMTDIQEAKSFVHKAHTNWIYSCRCVWANIFTCTHAVILTQVSAHSHTCSWGPKENGTVVEGPGYLTQVRTYPYIHLTHTPHTSLLLLLTGGSSARSIPGTIWLW